MTLKDMMMLYGVTLSERRTKKQKYLFAKQLKEFAEEKDIPFQVVEHKMGRYTVENIMVGNPKAADTILAVPYDTPTRSIVKCDYYPFHQQLTIKDEKRNLVVTSIISLAFVAIAYMGFAIAKGRILFYGSAVVSLLIAASVLFLNGNKVNFNRHSASVATATKLLEDCKKNKVCVIFCDKITKGYDGYRLLVEHIHSKAQIIALDCIAYGEKLVVAHGKEMSDEAKLLADKLNALDKCYSNEQMKNNVLSVLPNCLFVTSGEIENGELVVKNTRSKNDVKLDMNRLEMIEKEICDYINR